MNDKLLGNYPEMTLEEWKLPSSIFVAIDQALARDDVEADIQKLSPETKVWLRQKQKNILKRHGMKFEDFPAIFEAGGLNIFTVDPS